ARECAPLSERTVVPEASRDLPAPARRGRGRPPRGGPVRHPGGGAGAARHDRVAVPHRRRAPDPRPGYGPGHDARDAPPAPCRGEREVIRREAVPGWGGALPAPAP